MLSSGLMLTQGTALEKWSVETDQWMQSILNTAIMKMALQLARTQAWWRARHTGYRFCLNGMCTLPCTLGAARAEANAGVPVERSLATCAVCCSVLCSVRWVSSALAQRSTLLSETLAQRDSVSVAQSAHRPARWQSDLNAYSAKPAGSERHLEPPCNRLCAGSILLMKS